VPQIGWAADDLTEAAAGVSHQHPPAFDVDVDDRGDAIRLQLEELGGQGAART
jgi:hypothetical protein